MDKLGENTPLSLDDIEVYLDEQKICFINQNTCEEGILICGLYGRYIKNIALSLVW